MTFEQALIRYYEETFGEHASSTGKDILSVLNDILEKNGQERKTETGSAVYEMLKNIEGKTPEPKPISDGNTHFWITIPDIGKIPTSEFTFVIRIEPAEENEIVSGTIEWGDGEETSYEISSWTEYSHNYVHAGDYVCSLKVDSGNIAISGHNKGTASVSDDVSGVSVDYLFNDSRTLASVVDLINAIEIGSDVLRVGYRAFYSLSCKILGQLPTVIGESAFYGNRSIESVVLPEGLLSISSNSFSQCTSLQFVTIPDSVTALEANAFNSSDLLCVTLPSNLTSIGDREFYSNSNLSYITLKSVTPPSLSSPDVAFSGCPDDFVIYVPAESVDTYKAATGWSTYASRIFAEPEVTS